MRDHHEYRKQYHHWPLSRLPCGFVCRRLCDLKSRFRLKIDYTHQREGFFLSLDLCNSKFQSDPVQLLKDLSMIKVIFVLRTQQMAVRCFLRSTSVKMLPSSHEGPVSIWPPCHVACWRSSPKIKFRFYKLTWQKPFFFIALKK